MKDIFLSKIEPETNTFRFYRLVLPPGSRALLLQWGRIGEYLTERWESHRTHSDALEALQAIQTEKEASGYTLSDQRVMPKTYLFYRPRPEAVSEPTGQLMLFDFEG